MTVPPSEIQADLDGLINAGQHTIRDGILTLLAMEVQSGAIVDWHRLPIKGSPARAVSSDLGRKIYPALHIAGSPEALQTGVKGLATYRNRSTTSGHWEAVLDWATLQTDVATVEQAFLYLADCVAATARNLPPMPVLDTPRLNFSTVFALLDGLLSQRSAGAHEQFVFAALLEAWRSQLGEPGVVETKNLNAADAAAGTAGDVQEKYRGQVTEAYELTAGGFATKITQAASTLRQHDLRRVHIVARGAARASGAEIAAALPDGVDLTILDVREESRSMLARLDKPHRRAALTRLYGLLVDKQPNDALVRGYVKALTEHQLTETT